MTTVVGVNALRQRARDLLRLVETMTITNRGRPVALLAPLSQEAGPLERLRASGAPRGASGNLDDLAEPLDPGEGELPSVVLERMRRDER